MTRTQTPPTTQHITIPPDRATNTVETTLSPLEAMRVMQLAVEGGQEQIKETKVSRTIAPEIAERIVTWAGENSLDWDALIESREGWGTPEP
jgi:hypothetical protein